MKEQQGKGKDYRRDTLQKYSNFVQTEKEFALIDFRSRHSQASSAIGYGKTLMLFHMLRIQVGDETFKKGLRKFYSQYKFRLAGFTHIKSVFEEISGQDLKRFFNQWIRWTGSPQISLENVTQEDSDNTYRIKFQLNQAGQVYDLLVPISLWSEVSGEPQLFTVRINKAQSVLELKSKSKITRLQVDPQFDVFRRLDENEIPAALAQGYGSTSIVVVLPHKGDASYRHFQALAEQWKQTQAGNWQIVESGNMKALNTADAVWILGNQNPLKNKFSELLPQGVSLNNERLNIEENGYSLKDHSFAACRKKDKQTVCYISEVSNQAIDNLARKLPHYHKYGYLVFRGDDATNVLKGSWTTEKSPFIHDFSKPMNTLSGIKPRQALAVSAFR
jgi:hypothetical protein